MNRDNAPFLFSVPQPRKNQSGQVFVLTALMLGMFLPLAAFVVDLGYAWACYQKLQASADAAAIAAASVLPNWTLAQQYASLYSATPGNKNVIPGLTATMSVTYACSQELATQFDMVCPSASTAGNEQIVSANAIQVVEHASVPTFFAKTLGLSAISMTVIASARARGGAPTPVNVVVVAQATGHTGGVADSKCPIYTDNGASFSGTIYQADCIKSGIRILLSQLWPCPQGQTCNGSNPVDEVSLMIFPGLNSSNAQASQAAEYTPCGDNNNLAKITPYIDESYAASTNPLFTVVPFSDDYRTSTASLLNGGASHLVQAVDWTDGVGCTSANYGYANIWETDYAPAINAAQAALVANSRPNVQNVIILVSDGDAPGQGGCDAGNNYCNGGGLGQCQAGVTAAAAAAAAGTTVYSIAYGANTSGTCSLDTSGIQACTAMQEMAISPSTYPNPDPSKFYSDQGGQVGQCISAVNPSITSVTQIFQNIGVNLQTAALIENSTY
jgi:hypothetical protein